MLVQTCPVYYVFLTNEDSAVQYAPSAEKAALS